MKLKTIIGLEIHVQLKTKSKMFCGCDNTGENKPANTTICPVCVGHPGILPVANRQAIEWSAMAAIALNCKIPEFTKFDRKNYFYPDLSKGYQISQFDQPIGLGGHVVIDVDSKEKKIGLTRIHLEEDAAKNTHAPNGKSSYVDYNRGGTPLMEIVSEPDISTPEEAKIFLQELRLIMRNLEISDADMEKGHLRCDANISLKPEDDPASTFYPKTEIKNINSFKAVEKALAHEIKRQTKLWQEKNPPKEQSTRGWNEDKQVTEEQRGKEEAHDYRYFPEPDLPPIRFWLHSDQRCEDNDYIDVECIKATVPELPRAKRQRFMTDYEMSAADAKLLTETKEISGFVEHAISELKAWLNSLEETEGTEQEIWQKNRKKLTKLVCSWITSELFKLINESGVAWTDLKITPENFAEFITLIYQNKINSSAAQKILAEMFTTGQDPSQIMQEKNLGQMEDESELDSIVDQVIKENPSQVEEYKNGKEAVIQFLIGQVMKETRGKANPQKVAKMFKNKLK